jgi:hypothetical protein
MIDAVSPLLDRKAKTAAGSIAKRPIQQYRKTRLHKEIVILLYKHGESFINIDQVDLDEVVVQMCADEIVDVILNKGD